MFLTYHKTGQHMRLVIIESLVLISLLPPRCVLYSLNVQMKASADSSLLLMLTCFLAYTVHP